MTVTETAMHQGVDYESILAGKMVYNISDAPTWQHLSLCIVALVAIFQPTSFHKTRNPSISFWAVIIAITSAMPESTSFQILSTIISTRTSYPYIIVIPHSFIAAATYRSKHGDDVHYLQSLFLAFLLYGFGGSIVSDLLMGLPVTALSHMRIVPCYIIGWSLVWLSPFDIAYKTYSSSSSPLHLFFQACEAIDSVTTPMGRISRSARELPNKSSAPIVAGLMAGLGGAGVRHLVGESNSMEALEAGFWKTMSYSFLWWWLAVRNCQDETFDLFAGSINNDDERQLLHEHNHCDSYGGSNILRVIIVGSHTCWTILVVIGAVSGHPLVWFCKNILGNIWIVCARFFYIIPFSKPERAQGEKLHDGKTDTKGRKRKPRNRKISKRKNH